MRKNHQPHFPYVKTTTLLAIAGCVWLLAGFNIIRLGVMAYSALHGVQWWHVLLSCVVFLSFGKMFYGVSHKHIERIASYTPSKKPIWQFFDKKGYLLMAIMMSGGIYLRSSGLAPNTFIAIFYTGLGCALFLAGGLFLYHFKKNRKNKCFI